MDNHKPSVEAPGVVVADVVALEVTGTTVVVAEIKAKLVLYLSC